MKKIIYLFILLAANTGHTFSQCTEAAQPKVLLVGDSWAFFMDVDKTFNNVFKKYGHSEFRYITNSVIAENGAETDDFMKADKQAMIDSLIKANPSIEAIHLSIGGNDVLGDWKVSWTQAQKDTLKNQIYARLDSVFRFLKTTRPGIKIVWSGYVYPNFEEVIESAAPFQTSHPFYGTWQGMEFPKFNEINGMLNEFSSEIETYINADPQIEFYKVPGLMQYTAGQTTPLGVAPGGTYAPFTVPLPEGDPNYPSPKSTMRNYGITRDCFHLSPQGYVDLIGYQTQKFYQKFLMDDVYLLSENNTQTGSVSSQGAVADTLLLGERFGQQFATALSFNTTNIADTTFSKVSIFLRRKALDGANPVTTTLTVKVKNGNFGASADVEAADFSAAGDGSGAACVFGSNSADGDWLRIDLPTSLFPYVRNDAPTQFILSAPAALGGALIFNNSQDPELAPILNIAYGETPNGIADAPAASDFYIFPNPTSSILNIQAKEDAITAIEITDLMGKTVLKPAAQAVMNSIDIANLPTGVYAVNVYTKNGKATQRVVKQ
jgi:hypothetical protein